jgi:hypothetical protein
MGDKVNPSQLSLKQLEKKRNELLTLKRLKDQQKGMN